MPKKEDGALSVEEIEAMTQDVRLEMSPDEAVVLFDWLARFNSEDRPGYFESPAEQHVLFSLESLLERVLTEPLDPNYEQLVRAARQRLQVVHD